ncbi:hypothetical protein ABOM_012143 [Aspergillus bombycis]|uniref:Uncharacterized protein n=1 Tax=Aspergillus bombycis TaxID=109264 RepID=A0A1F7ZIV9_9EURO|nr:hypothetical protein ABOM_012143 [Aspergillus bombycis]OGM39390.1 hypothetical protein ABOM_012143 [Aspergillus bombycis]
MHGIHSFGFYTTICTYQAFSFLHTLTCACQIPMDCFASIIAFCSGIKCRLVSNRCDVQEGEVWNTSASGAHHLTTVQVLIFVGAERGPDDLVVTFHRNHFQDRLPWNEFKSLGPPAATAVVKAGWKFVALEQIAESIRARRFDEKELDNLRNEARDERKRISIRKPSDPVSVFEID